jgi:hypothetical protein
VKRYRRLNGKRLMLAAAAAEQFLQDVSVTRDGFGDHRPVTSRT